ncbi:MAG: hypothetical protein Q7R40_03870 [Phaeospirillum sp.]|nr:hypothetical protein [Phaeospirillum sp.]
MEVARHNKWEILDHRTSEFVMSTLRKCGCGIVDSDIEALIAINLGTSRHLASGRDVEQIRRRARLAWRESNRSGNTPLESWLIDQIERKARHPGSSPLAAKAG